MYLEGRQLHILESFVNQELTSIVMNGSGALPLEEYLGFRQWPVCRDLINSTLNEVKK